MIQKGLVEPKKEGELRLEVPAGLVVAKYNQDDTGRVTSVKITNVASFLAAENLEVECPDLGTLSVNVAYGGNFYAIIDLQKNYSGLQDYRADRLINWSRELRKKLNKQHEFVHPEDENIRGLSHIMWTGNTIDENASARNAVFYGDKAIDRSPCGTGPSARMAQWSSKGKLEINEPFIHESIIGSKFIGRIERQTKLAGKPAIIPSIEGWARITGYNNITIDDDDPYAHGFQVI